MSNPAADQSSRVPPHNLDAEESVLGAMMLLPDALQYAAAFIDDTDFYRDPHRTIFRVLVEIAGQGKPADPLLLCDELRSRGLLDGMGDKPYISQLLNTCPNQYAYRHYCKLVKDAAKAREVIDAGYEMVEAGYQRHTPVEDVLANAQSVLSPVLDSSVGDQMRSVGANLDSCREAIIGRQSGQTCSGLRTGFKHQDNLTNGLHGIVVLGGGTSSGKTTFIGQLCYQVAVENEVPVILFSLEQGASDIMVRLLSHISHVVNRDIARGSLGPFSPEVSQLEAAFETIKHVADRLYIFGPETEFSFNHAANIAHHAMREHGTDKCLVAIDSIHDISIDGFYRGDTERLNEVCKGIVKLATNLKNPVLVTSEINRQSYGKIKTRDEALRAFRDSGRIEFCSDLAMMLECREGTFDLNPRDMRLRVLKNRMGEVGNVNFRFFTDTSTFTETDIQWPEDE